jgi:hypothetical protein
MDDKNNTEHIGAARKLLYSSRARLDFGCPFPFETRKKKSPDHEGQDSSFQRRARAGSGAYSVGYSVVV